MKYLLSSIVLCFLYAPFSSAQSEDSSYVFHLIDSLHDKQRIYSDKVKYDSAIVYVNKALAISDQFLEKDHIRKAHLLHSKGYTQVQLRQFDEAEISFKESLRIKKKHFGVRHESYCLTLNNLGLVYLPRSDKSLAEEYFLKSKDCYEQCGDTSLIVYGHVMNNLGIIYKETGRYYMAEKAMISAIRAKESDPSANDIDMFYLPVSYRLLAEIYSKLGDFPRMEKAKSQECALFLQEPKQKEIHYYWRRNNLGNTYMELGDFEKACQYYQEAVEGKKLLLGPNDPDLAMSLNNLSNALGLTNRPAEAVQAALEAYSIYSLDSLKFNLHQGWTLNNLGFYSMGINIEKAREYTQRSLEKKVEALGTDNPDWNGTYMNLMAIDILEGNFESAEKNLIDRLAFYQQHLPEFEDTKRECLSLLADLYMSKNEAMKAKPYLEMLLLEDKLSLEEASQINIPSIMSSYVTKAKLNMDRYLSLNILDHTTDTSYTNTCYNLILNYKGYLLEALEKLRKSMLANSDFSRTTDAIRYLDYQLKEQYSILPLNKVLVDRLEAEKRTAEVNFALTIQPKGSFQNDITWKNIQSSLAESEAAIEFQCFNFNKNGSTDSMMYAAFLIRTGYLSPVYIPLFEEDEIQYLLNKQSEATREYIQLLYSYPSQDHHMPNFYSLIWKPILPFLNGITTIYYSSSGLLHRINLNAMESPISGRIIDTYQMSLKGSTRELFRPDTQQYNTSECVLIGGINYEIDKMDGYHLEDFESNIALASDFSSAISFTDPAIRGGTWNTIPGTSKEIENIKHILRNKDVNIIVLEGSDASEENIGTIGNLGDKIKSPWIIHLSTHGYFFPDPNATNGIFSFNTEPVFKISDHPMIRSGLILAGGNYAWKYGHPYKPGMEDGILTAYEISQMDLSNTELVVLSACETGLGDIKGNEGVFGLQRAFKIAGVKNLIMSLWKVPDAATAELMIKFYSNWLEKKMTIREALHSAQKEMREEGWEVYDWAGFVLVE